MAALREDGDDCFLSLHVVCRSSRNAVVGAANGLIVVCVRAAPAGGEANAAVIDVLSAFLKCPPSRLSLVRGHKNREKVVRIKGISAAHIAGKLGGLI